MSNSRSAEAKTLENQGTIRTFQISITSTPRSQSRVLKLRKCLESNNVVKIEGTLEQRKRRLKRTETTLDVNSDTGHNSNKQKVVQMEKNALIAELNDMEPMSLGSDVVPELPPKPKHREPKKRDDNPVKIDREPLKGDCMESVDILKQYIDLKFKEFKDETFKKLDSIKASLAYDIKKEVTTIKHQIVASQSAKLPSKTLTCAMEDYKGIFPINNLDNFITFHSSLKTSPEEREKILELYRVLLYGENDVGKCVHKTISTTITPAVQLKYSGTGKKVHGVGKIDFSSTNIYSCLKDVIQEKFGDSLATNNLGPKVGTFLANAGDRDGGRRRRAPAVANQPTDDNQHE